MLAEILMPIGRDYWPRCTRQLVLPSKHYGFITSCNKECCSSARPSLSFPSFFGGGGGGGEGGSSELD